MEEKLKKQYEEIAHALLSKHGLVNWRFVWDRAVTRAGACHYNKSVISASDKLITNLSEEEFRQIILHEIAHAICGMKNGHNKIWQQKAKEIGYKGSRTIKIDNSDKNLAKWLGLCPKGHKHYRHRVTKNTTSCAKCDKKFNPAHKIVWHKNDI